MVFLLVWSDCRVVGATRELPEAYAKFFRALGHRVRTLRTQRGYSQEDMILHGFSVRHWQMVEAGRPCTVFTLLRICDAFELSLEELVRDLPHQVRKRKGQAT